MTTFITDTPQANGLSGSTERRLDQSPDGTLWLLIVNGNDGKMFFTEDTGSTWEYAGLDSDVTLAEDGTSLHYPSMFIDLDGYAHVCWTTHSINPQVINYAYGVPVNGGGWEWTYTSFTGAAGRLAPRSDIIAFRESSATRVFIGYSIHGTAGVAAPKVAKLSVTYNGTITLDAAAHGPATTVDMGTNPSVTLEFSHTGDGKTPSATPDVWMASAFRTSTGLVRVWKAAYSGGVWTWAAPVAMGASLYNVDNRILGLHWTGAVLLVRFVGVGVNGRTIRLFHFDGTTATAHDSTAASGSNPLVGFDSSMDPATGDLYCAAYGTDDGDILVNIYDFSTTTWSGWAVAQSRFTSNAAGRLSMLRTPAYDAIPVVYGEDDAGGVTMHHYSFVLDQLPLVPDEPVLVYPLDGATLDLASGATFTWRYQPVGPGDVQSAWAFTRAELFLGVNNWWNQAAQTWESTEFWNPGSDTEAVFPAGTWAHGDGYTWSVAVKSAAGIASDYVGPAWEVNSAPVPTVEVTGPSPTVYLNSTPKITWEYTYAEPQATYEVRVTLDDGTIDPDDPSPVVWSVGPVQSSDTREVQVTTPLTDETAYTAWVQVTAEDMAESVWEPINFHLSVSAPDGPTLTTEIEEDDDEVPSVKITVTGKANYMSAEQALGGELWEANGAGKTLAHVGANGAAGILAGFSVTKTGGSGTADFVSAEGLPPATETGEAALLGPLDFPVKEGVEYTFLGYVMATGVGRVLTPWILWYNDDEAAGPVGSEDAADAGSQVTANLVAYSQFHVTATAPAGAKRARVYGSIASAATTDVHYFARLSFAPGDSLVWGPGGLSETMTLRVERSSDAGETWETIAEGVGVDFWQQAIIYDATAPTSVPLLYRAYMDLQVPSLTGDDGIVGSDPGDEDETTVATMYWIMRDPLDPRVQTRCIVEGHDRGDKTPSEVHRPIGRDTPIIDVERIELATGTFTFFIQDGHNWKRTHALLRRLTPVVLISPTGTTYTVVWVQRDYETEINKAETLQADYVEVEGARRGGD